MTLEFNEDHTPLAYLITFRCYGTWLHGNEKGSVDRHRNRYGSPFIPSDPRWRRHNLNSLKEDPVRLTKGQRATVTTAIKDTCELRKWTLYTVNTRTNHCHVVVNGACGPGRILNALKANATRELREKNQWRRSDSPWADGGSKRYLWTQAHLQTAIDYVELDQGDVLPAIDEIDLI